MTRNEMMTALLPGATETQIKTLNELAEEQFLTLTHQDDVPDGADGVIVRMAQVLYSRIGAEGLASQSYSGASESFLSDWPNDLRRAINRYRKLVCV